MTVRQRAKRTQVETEDRAWPARREYLVRYFPGDHLLECSEFWRREPGVPDELRADPLRWRHLMASEPHASEIRAKRAELLDRRRKWLAENGYR